MWDGLILPFVVAPAKHAVRLVTDRNYLVYCLLATRLWRFPRYTPRTLKMLRMNLAVPDVASFLSTYRELFVEQIYRFDFPDDTPRILDLGANIGLSVLYFKELFPNSKISAYEADPSIFEYLQRNIRTHGFYDVELVQGAVWHKQETLYFHSEGSDAGRIVTDGGDDSISVPAFDIKSILGSGEFNVLKMDIEGAEVNVLKACRGLLGGLRFIFVEYHSSSESSQQLNTILEILTEGGFRYHIESINHLRSPFLEHPAHNAFDLQLNIFASRNIPC